MKSINNERNYGRIKEIVRDANDIVTIVEEYGVKLSKSGKVYKGLCPFHSETQPSFTVYRHTNSWYCYGCKKGGDVYQFVMEIESCNFLQAIEKLAQRAELALPDWTPEQKEAQTRQRRNERILELSALFYHFQLLISPEVETYLVTERDLTSKTLSVFRIGYAPVEKDGQLLRFLQRHGFSKSDAISAGVLYKNGKEYFLGMITFPYTYMGRTVYMTGRGYPEKSFKKPLADKIPFDHLFFEDSLNIGSLCMTEGEIDTLTLLQAGINACGIPGVNCFKEAWKDRFDKCKTVYIALDNDQQGIQATLRLGALFKDRAKVIILPDYTNAQGFKVKDCNDLLAMKHLGDVVSFKEEFQELANAALPFLDFKIVTLLDNASSKDKVGIVNEQIIPDLLSLGPMELDIYVNFIVHLLKGKIKRAALLKEIEKRRNEALEFEPSTIEILDGEYTFISSNQAFVNDVGYISAYLPTNSKKKKNNLSPFIVSSNKEMFAANREECEKRKLFMSNDPSYPDERWRHQLIKKYLESKDKTDAAKVFSRIENLYDSYVDFRAQDNREVLSIWTIGTYLHRLFDSYPYIFLTGVTGSGKTKTLNVASRLCFNAMHVSNITQATIFRMVESSSCTLLIDEAEALKSSKASQDIVTLLHSGYKKGVRVPRCNPNTYEPEYYELYSPKIIANIRGLGPVLEGRCIKFRMLRTGDVAKLNKNINDRDESWDEIRHMLYCFALDHFQQLNRIYLNGIHEDSTTSITGREAELWHPLLAIAKFLDDSGCKGLYERTKKTANEMSEEAKSQCLDDWTTALIFSVADIVLVNRKTKRISTSNIISKMEGYLDEDALLPKPRWIGERIRNLDFVVNSKKVARGIEYDLSVDKVVEVLKIYGLVKEYKNLHSDISLKPLDDGTSGADRPSVG